jgi:broad specificity phosphatase PhoE
MIELLVFRHGETDWNLNFKFQGHTDIPLNLTGKEQAQSLISKLDQFKTEIIICSDLVRAQETARIANTNCNVPIELFKELRECHLGEAEGLHRDDVERKYGVEAMASWNSLETKDLGFSFPGGETKLQNLQNIIRCIESFVAKNPKYKRIAVSSHGGTLKRLLHHCNNAPLDLMTIPNCAAYSIEFSSTESSWLFKGEIS